MHHRPARVRLPESAASAPDSWNPDRPRRFDPRTLPLGLVQVVGHVTNGKLLSELADWVPVESRSRLQMGLRVLQTDGSAMTLRPWEEVLAYPLDQASMVFIDIGLSKANLQVTDGRFLMLPVAGFEVP